MNKLTEFPIWIKGRGILATIILIGGFAIGTGKAAPDHVIVFGDLNTNFYYGPPCVMDSGFDDSTKLIFFAFSNSLDYGSIGELEKKGFKPHLGCRHSGGFYQNGRSLSGILLENCGLLPKFKSRWNADGTWNN